MIKVVNKLVYSLLVVVILCASLSSNRVYASQPSNIEYSSINNSGTIVSSWQNQAYGIIGDTSAFLNYYDAKTSKFILESIYEGYITFTKFSEWHERKFANLYYDAQDITSRAEQFVADHASIGIRNTKKYSKQYSQELVSEVGSNSSTLGSLIKLSYEQVLFDIGNLPNSISGAFDRVAGVVDSVVATWQRDGRALAQFSRSVQFTTTGQTLASQELEKHSAFSDIVPVISLPKVTVGDIQNFSNNILDSADTTFHSYVVNDLISSQDRVIISAKTISEEAQAVVVDVDMGIVASLDVLLNKTLVLAESLGRKVDYASIALLDSSLFANLSTNGKYLHDNFSKQIVEDDFSSQIKLANAEPGQYSGRVLGDSAGVSWVGKVWCWLVVCPATELVPVIVDEQDEASGDSTATTTTTTVNVEEGVIESAVTRVINRFIALGLFDFLEGDKGETGEQGPQGSPGATGERGAAGSSSVSSGSSFDSSELVIGSGTLDASAILQANSTTRGFLAPRMTTVERDAISSPATGLLVYNSTTDAFNVYNGATWGAIGGGTTNLATDVTGVLAVSNGGTGTSSLSLNGLVYGNGTSAVQVTAAPTSGQLLIGNVSGVPVFVSVSGDIAIDNTGATTIQSNSVALGTDTAGNYVATIAGDSQISVSGSGSETAAVSLSIAADSIGDSQLAFNIGQNLTTVSSPTFAALNVVGTSTVGISYTNSVGHALMKVDGDAISQAGYYIYKAGVEKVQIAVLGGSDDLTISMAGTDRFVISSVGNVQLDGDLTISGNDLFMGTNTSGFILVADGTNFNPVAMSGDITIDSTGATAIVDEKVTEADLKAVDAAGDEECLTYESTVGDFEWQSCDSGGGGSISALTAASGTNSIDNTNYQQSWAWDTLAGGTGLALSASTTAAASNTQKLLSLSLSGANATSTQTTYGGYITNTHTGTSSTNVGLYASASGGTNNYAAIFENGSVGIGDTTPDATLHVVTASAITKGIIVKGSSLGSGIEPDDISGLVVWLKADSLSLNNNDPVTSWTNSSGSGNDATQGTGASQPLYIASGTNGKPVVRFDGTDDFLAMDSTVTNSRTLLMVIRHVDGSSPTGESPIGESTAFDYFGEAGTDLINSLGGTNVDIASGQGYTNGAYTAVLNIQKPANIYSIITIVGTANSSFNWIGDTYHYLGASQYWEGDIAEIIAYDSALSIANKEAVEKYLSDKYNISVTASSGGQTVNLQEWQNSSGTALASVNEAGRMLIAPDPSGSGSPNLLSITGPAHVNLDASVEASDVKLALNRTVTFSTGALTMQRAVLMSAPTYAFVAASTITDAATLGISGAPVKSTNASITNTHALLISAGAVSTATNSFGLTVNAQTGATNNYSAQFMGGNVGIGDASPAALLSVGNGDLFKVTSAGTISSVVGITSSSNYVQSAGTFSLTSANTTQVTTASAAAFNLNSLTSGTGIYAASSTLSSGKLVDLQVSGTAATSNTQTVLNILNAGATSTNAQTTYGAQISNTRTNATSGTNVALYLNASGATTANYGLIVNSGRVGIGTTTPSYPLHVVLGAAGVVARFTDSDGSCDIDPTSTALVCTSDERLKEDVVTIESALEKVMNFRGVNFHWKSQTDDALRIGFLAQEVEAITPELVKTDPKTGLKSVNYVGFTPILVNAIHEQQEQIDTLQLAVNGVQGDLAGNLDQPILLKSHLYLTSDSVGQAQILSGDREVRINFTKSYEYQPIVTISARGEAALDNSFRYTVVDEDSSGFTIKISDDQTEAVEFNWHAFAGQDAKLTVSNGNTSTITLVVAGQQSSELDSLSEDPEPVIDEGSVAGVVSEESPDEQMPVIEPEETQEEPEVQDSVESGTEVSLAE